MDKKQVTDLRSELLDSRFGAKSISTIAESKRFPLHEMRDDVAFQIINDELYLDGNARQNLATFCQTWDDENVHKLMDLSINGSSQTFFYSRQRVTPIVDKIDKFASRHQPIEQTFFTRPGH